MRTYTTTDKSEARDEIPERGYGKRHVFSVPFLGTFTVDQRAMMYIKPVLAIENDKILQALRNGAEIEEITEPLESEF